MSEKDNEDKNMAWCSGAEKEIFDTIVNYQLAKRVLTDVEKKTNKHTTPTEEISDLEEDSTLPIKAKDSALIHQNKHQNKRELSDNHIKHKLQICFKLPPSQEVMILEKSSLRHVKELRNLEHDDDLKEANITVIKSVKAGKESNDKCPAVGTLKQRAIEIHRHRIAVEQKRLELLEIKLEREREALKRERLLNDQQKNCHVKMCFGSDEESDI